MSPFKVILVPTDFADPAEVALDRAVDLARGTDSRIVLLYACPLPQVTAMNGALVPSMDVVGSMRQAGHEALQHRIDARRDCGVPISSKVVVDDPRSAILECIKDDKVDLVVMGTHGRRGISRWLLGSTAEAVVRTSPVPVMTIRETKDNSASNGERKSA